MNEWYQVLRISADSPDSISCGRDHYVNWKREQQPGLGCDRGDYGQHNREHEQNLEFERKLFYLLFASDDKREGMRAFLEKRPGRFTGR